MKNLFFGLVQGGSDVEVISTVELNCQNVLNTFLPLDKLIKQKPSLRNRTRRSRPRRTDNKKMVSNLCYSVGVRSLAINTSLFHPPTLYYSFSHSLGFSLNKRSNSGTILFFFVSWEIEGIFLIISCLWIVQ